MTDKIFFDNYDGQDCYLYVLHGDGIEAGITDLGAAVQYIRVHTKQGIKDVALGYSTIKERLQSGTYCGATIGRVANRIKNSQFVLSGTRYNIPPNDGKNCNHGGVNGFDERLFKAETCGDILRLTLLSSDGDMGFPGNLTFVVEYELKNKTLEIRYSALSDKDTLWSPTCHAYFNLNGEDCGNISDTVLKINAEKITLSDGDRIATGETAYVAGTPFDFTRPTPIGVKIDCDNEQLKSAGGYDHNYILKSGHAATAYNASSGLKLDLYTDLPGLQLYTGNFLKGIGKTREYQPRDGFCLEPQYFPNAINIDGFDAPILTANKEKKHYIRYEFKVSD